MISKRMIRMIVVLFLCSLPLGASACGSESENDMGLHFESISDAVAEGSGDNTEGVSGKQGEDSPDQLKDREKTADSTVNDREKTSDSAVNDQENTVDSAVKEQSKNSDDAFKDQAKETVDVSKEQNTDAVDTPAEQGEDKTDVLTEEQALAAIKKYCLINNPDLESMVGSDEYTVYWDVTTNENNEIVVLFRSYTGAQIRYYIDPVSGEAHVTELVPGIIDEEQPSDEKLNVRDYL